MEILNTINSPEALKELDFQQLETLASEIRAFLIENIGRTGGHLASNLGVVELTIALHRVYDTGCDRICFDVGHQSYVHKILTGRRDDFASLRTLDGLSGFPKPAESVHDAAIAGHASTSISSALGMARARRLLGENYSIAALIGDGAMTGGLAFEGLSDAGSSNEPMVIVINDNGMSIGENVGGVVRVLSKLRLKPNYIRFKRWYRRIIGKLPPLYNLTHKFKEWLKFRLLPQNIFYDLGFEYLGPVDGHDIEHLETVLGWAKELNCPVVVHAVTQKGRGYQFAEEHPEDYHGVSSFDTENGVEAPQSKSFSEVFGRELTALAELDEKLVAVTASMCVGTGLAEFAEKYPTRFFDVGIAEGHAVTMAAGMASRGLTPVFAVYSTFLQRSYDMLIHDVALSKEHVVLAIDRAGLVGPDGETHQGSFDVPFLYTIPGIAVLSPSSYAELRDMLTVALYRIKGPVALRYSRGGEGRFTASTGVAPTVVLSNAADMTLVTYGMLINNAIEAAAALEKDGISVEIVKLNLINPIDTAPIEASLRKTGVLFVLEDCAENGCVGERLLAFCAEKGITLKGSCLKNLGNGVVKQGTVEQLQAMYGLDAYSISSEVLSLFETFRDAT